MAVSRNENYNYQDSAVNIGIKAMEIYFPKLVVFLIVETYDKVSAGKYTLGLGQLRMGFCDDNEATELLMTKYNIDYNSIGRLEVGTETIIDKSKSVKTVLMRLFQDHGNTNIEGIDNKNACYGGTAALFNSINWMESSYWDGRLALVVAADIAIYASGNARPTGGCGAVAMLIGPNAPLVFDRGLRVSCMQDVYDFYKPDLLSEYPVVNGSLSVECYLKALDSCFSLFKEKFENIFKTHEFRYNTMDYFVFHSPYAKLVQKSYGRLAFNDFLLNHEDDRFKDYFKFKNNKLEDTYFDKDIERAFLEYTREDFEKRVLETLTISKQVGNIYCGSLYGGLISLISNKSQNELIGKRIGLFSYGSGFASSMFSITCVSDYSYIAENIDLANRLDSRKVINPENFEKIMKNRELTHHKKGYRTTGSTENLFENTHYLVEIDDNFQRFYQKNKN